MNIRKVVRDATRQAERNKRLNYLLVYRLVRRLDRDPWHDSYWRVSGQRCDTLGEVVAAILEN